MTVQTINIGNQVNDGLGDDLRTAFEKVNANFAELDDQLAVTGLNLGSAGAGIYKQNSGGQLQFRRLIAGTRITLTELTDTIQIDNSQPEAFTRFDTDAGTMLASTFQEITVQGRFAAGSYTKQKDIEVTAFGSNLYFQTRIPVTEILSNFDFGTINGIYNNSVQLALASSNIDFGTIQYPSTINLDAGGIL